MQDYKRDGKLQERLNSELNALSKKKENSTCCDCGGKPTRYVSVKLGTFICNRCFAIHRNVGAHVTRVKCIGLDAWHPDEIDLLKSMGNARVKTMYEAKAPPSAIPKPGASDYEVEKWIRDKYEKRKYFKEEQVTTTSLSSTGHTNSIQPTTRLEEYHDAPLIDLS